MVMRKLISLIAAAFTILILATGSYGFAGTTGACGGDCQSCHSLKPAEAQGILSSFNPSIKVLGVAKSKVGGLWEVTFEFMGKKSVIYVDYAKKHLIQGSIIDIKTKADITSERMSQLNKVDVSKIPLSDALILGKANAPIRVIVFDDPV
ncbi:MAG: hypothetical protein M0Z75_13380 [Nitrospiraceae bacterium]|nr:hypothetical protein [Nitrospiraceae bacterium]